MDLRALAKAMRQPGSDPRQWVSLGIVQAVVADTEGIFVDVLLLPEEETVTARLGAIYAGNGFGVYAGLKKDDEVLLTCPDGDAGLGWVVSQRLWSKADPPPTLPTDTELYIRVEEDKHLKIETTGTGNIQLHVGAKGTVELAGSSGEKIVMGQTLQAMLSGLMTQLAVHVHGSAVGPTTPPQNAAAFTTYKTTPIDDGKMLSDRVEAEK